MADLPRGIREQGTITFADSRKPPIVTQSGPDYDEESWARAGARPVNPMGGGLGNPASLSPEQDAAARRAERVQAETAKLQSYGYSPEQASKIAENAVPGQAPPPPKPPAPDGIVFMQPGAGQQQVAPQTVVPAHEQPLADPKRQAVEQAAYGSVQKAIGNEADAVEGEKSAERNLGAARGGVNEAKAEGWRSVAKAAEDAGWDIKARAAESKSRSDAYLKRLDAFSEDLANDKIDPNAQWNNASTGRQITWTLAKMFGAIQQGALGLPSNQVADRLDAMAKADVDAQKANHSIKRGRLEDMQNLFSLALKQTKDENEAAALAHGYALEAAKAEAMALGDAAGTPVAKAEAEKLVAALGEKQAQLGQKIAETGVAAVQRGIAENKWVPAGVAGGVGKPVDAKNIFFDPVTKTYYAARSEESKKLLAKTATGVVDFDAAAKAYRDALAQLGTWDRVRGKVGADTPALSDAWSKYYTAAGVVRKMNDDGVFRTNPGEFMMINHTLAPPDAFFGDPVKQLDGLTHRVRALHAANMQVETPTPVVEAPQPIGASPKSVPTGQLYAPPGPAPAPSALKFTPVGAGPEAKAKGGKVGSAQPYLVGEKGPELVVPDKDGFVLTALQTAALRGAPPTKQQLDSLPRREEGGPVSYLYEPPGAELHVGDNDRAYYASAAPARPAGASLSGPAPRYSSAPPAARPAPAQPAQRQMTPDEMMREADRMIAQTKAQTAAAEARGPAVQLERREEGGPYGPALPVVATTAPPAQTWGYTPDTGDVGQDASQMVDAQRNAGGYAQLDMTPIPTPPQGSGTYDSQDDLERKQSFDSALASSAGEGADPYQRNGKPEAAPQDRAAGNAEAAAETRKRFEADGPDFAEKKRKYLGDASAPYDPAMTAGDQYDASQGSMGDRAEAKSKADAKGKKADKGSILKQIFQAIASGGSRPADDEPARRPLYQRAYGGPMMAQQPQPQGPPITPYSGMTGSTGLGRAGTPAYPPAYPQRAFGGPMHVSTKQTGVGDMSAGELGMNGVGGLVSGNIDRANQDVSDEIHQAGGMGMRANGGPMVAPTSREIFQALARPPVMQPRGTPADPPRRSESGSVAPTSREVFQSLARMPVVQPQGTPADSSRSSESGSVAPTSREVFQSLARTPVVQPREDGGPIEAIRRLLTSDKDRVAGEAAASARARPAQVASDKTPLEVYRVPAVSHDGSVAPLGSGPVTAAGKDQDRASRIVGGLPVGPARREEGGPMKQLRAALDTPTLAMVLRALAPPPAPPPPRASAPRVPREDKVASAGVFDAMEKGSADRLSRANGGPVRGKTQRRI